MSEMATVKRNPAAAKIAQAILEEYDVNSIEDMQSALKDVFGPMFEAMLKEEMNNYLGYAVNKMEDPGYAQITEKTERHRKTQTRQFLNSCALR